MRLNKLFIVLLAIFSLLTSCEFIGNGDDKEFETRVSNGSVSIENVDTSNLSVSSLIDESSLNNGSFSIEVFDNDLPQLLMVTNNNNDVVMLYKGVIPENGNIEINAHSTATAILTFHPALAEINGGNYQEMINVFTSASSFPAFLSEIENSIAQNKAIYDTTNTNLISAAQEVFLELFGDSVNMKNTKATSHLTNKFDCWPIDVNYDYDDSRTLKFRMPGLFPSYECKVYDEEGDYESSFYVPTRGNYGLWDAFLGSMGESDLVYGEEAIYNFNNTNKRTFVFNRLGSDTFTQLAGCVLQTIGLPDVTDDVELVADVSFSIETAIIQNEISLMNPGNNWQTILYSVIPIAFEATLEVLKNHTAEIISSKAQNLLKILKWVNIVEGAGNALGRFASHWICENEITFCAQYYSAGYFDKCGATNTYNASVKCNWANSCVANFTLDLPIDEEYQIPSTTIYTYDYDGAGLKLVYYGSYNNELNLTVSTYKAEDNSLIRTDVFNGLLIGDTVSLHGNTTFYDDLEGCPMVLELIWVDNEDKKSKTILNQVTNKNSRTNQCTIIGHKE